MVSLIGELLLKNGAETYRVEETIRKVGSAYDFVKTEVFALPTGLFISLEDKDSQSWTRIKRIKHQTTNLQKVSMVNDLSRQITTGQIEVNQALMELREINNHGDSYSAVTSYLAAGIGGVTFSYLVYGLRLELIPAFIGALLLEIWMHSNNINKFMAEVVSGGIASTIGIVSNYFYPVLDYNLIILGIIIILVPGVSITNAARDIIGGDSLAGIVRGMNALLTALAIALGVASILGVKILV
nr:threonine/serine exporter family protein [Sporohalobacter salinus]